MAVKSVNLLHSSHESAITFVKSILKYFKYTKICIVLFLLEFFLFQYILDVKLQYKNVKQALHLLLTFQCAIH